MVCIPLLGNGTVAALENDVTSELHVAFNSHTQTSNLTPSLILYPPIFTSSSLLSPVLTLQVRLMLTLAPAACMLGAIGMSATLSTLIRFLLEAVALDRGLLRAIFTPGSASNSRSSACTSRSSASTSSSRSSAATSGRRGGALDASAAPAMNDAAVEAAAVSETDVPPAAAAGPSAPSVVSGQSIAAAINSRAISLAPSSSDTGRYGSTVPVYPAPLSLAALCGVAALLVHYALHCVWVASEKYSR